MVIDHENKVIYTCYSPRTDISVLEKFAQANKYRAIAFLATDKNANPAIGEAGGDREWVDEVKIEVLVQKHKEVQVMKALFENHPYEEVAYEFIALQNPNQEIGAGLIGTLPEPVDEKNFLSFLKERMKTDCVRHTELSGKPVQRVAVCGGSGSFLLKDAIRRNCFHRFSKSRKNRCHHGWRALHA